MYGQSGSYAITDPHVSRLIEETVNSVEDVEKRLTNIKLGIVQTFPHLAPILQARELQVREQNAFVLSRFTHGMGSLPMGIDPRVPVTGFAPGLGLGMGGVQPHMFGSFSPLAGQLQGGLGLPLGAPFRLW